MSQQEVDCVCHSLSSYSGGVLPILAQQWITEVWGVHIGDSGGGEAAGLCVEDYKCSACQGQSRAYALRYTITEYYCFLQSGNACQISQFHITNWAPDGSCSNLRSVTDVIEEVSKVQRRTGNQTIVMHCR